MDDFSDRFTPLRASLLQETGGEYLRYVQSLQPRFLVVWRDIVLGYVFLGLVIFMMQLPDAPVARALAALPGAIAIGYGIAYLQLFLHEASHHNLARSRSLNDWLCNVFISWQSGTSVERYRPVHFAHHRELGTTSDTENSYFNPLTLRFLLETLSGVHALRVMSGRGRTVAGTAARKPAGTGAGGPLVLLRGVLVHGAIVSLAFAWAGWPAALAWVVGTAAFFPLFGAIRQLTEHRSAKADPRVDYGRVDHGTVSRMFGTGPLASTLGGAGFNRHLLHHWEPLVSYTRLGDLERYLEATSAAPIMAARRTSYGKALAEIWRNDHRREPVASSAA